jgi:hypothetical protein
MIFSYVHINVCSMTQWLQMCVCISCVNTLRSVSPCLVGCVCVMRNACTRVCLYKTVRACGAYPLARTLCRHLYRYPSEHVRSEWLKPCVQARRVCIFTICSSPTTSDSAASMRAQHQPPSRPWLHHHHNGAVVAGPSRPVRQGHHHHDVAMSVDGPLLLPKLTFKTTPFADDYDLGKQLGR